MCFYQRCSFLDIFCLPRAFGHGVVQKWTQMEYRPKLQCQSIPRGKVVINHDKAPKKNRANHDKPLALGIPHVHQFSDHPICSFTLLVCRQHPRERLRNFEAHSAPQMNRVLDSDFFENQEDSFFFWQLNPGFTKLCSSWQPLELLAVELVAVEPHSSHICPVLGIWSWSSGERRRASEATRSSYWWCKAHV